MPASIEALCQAAQITLASARHEGADARSFEEFEIEADVWTRLARDLAMRSVWRALHRRQRWTQGRRGHDGKLVREIVSELLDARVRSPRTKAQRRDALLEVAAKARELKQLVTEASADGLHRWCQADEDVPSRFFDSLDKLQQEATDRAHRRGPRIKRTPTAPAISLARRLNRFFIGALNEPLHEHVASIVNAICESQLSRDNVKSAVRVSQAAKTQ